MYVIPYLQLCRAKPTPYVDPEGELFFLAAIPYLVGAAKAAMTAYDIYDTVDGLASGRITKEDLAAGYLLNKGIEIGLKALPGVGIGVSMVYRAAKKGNITKGADELVTVRHHTDVDGLNGIKKSQEIWQSRSAGMSNTLGVHVEVAPFMSPNQATRAVGLGGKKGGYVEFQVPGSSLEITNVGPANTAVISTNGNLSLQGKNSKFKKTWYRFWE